MLISRFCLFEISPHSNFAVLQLSRAFRVYFSCLLNFRVRLIFASLSNSRKLNARKNFLFYSNYKNLIFCAFICSLSSLRRVCMLIQSGFTFSRSRFNLISATKQYSISLKVPTLNNLKWMKNCWINNWTKLITLCWIHLVKIALIKLIVVWVSLILIENKISSLLFYVFPTNYEIHDFWKKRPLAVI